MEEEKQKEEQKGEQEEQEEEKREKNAKYGELKFHSIAGKSNSFTIKTPLV